MNLLFPISFPVDFSAKPHPEMGWIQSSLKVHYCQTASVSWSSEDPEVEVRWMDGFGPFEDGMVDGNSLIFLEPKQYKCMLIHVILREFPLVHCLGW